MESELQREILIKFGARNDMKIWRNNTGAGYGVSIIQRAMALGYIPDNLPVTHYGVKGSADILGILKGGRFFGIETKTLKGRQSPEQKLWQAMVEGIGGLYILARSVEDVEKELVRKMGI